MIKPLISLFLSVVCLSACTAKLPQSVNEIPLTYISTLDNKASFAATPDGDLIAYSHRGLTLLDTASGFVKVLATREPDFLAWSVDGRQLSSVTLESDASSRIAIYSEEGEFLRDYEVPGVVNGLKWTAQGDLLATGYLLKVYSFGSNLQQKLYRLADGEVAEVLLADSTLKPGTTKILAPVMADILPARFSPYGDELVYLRLHDPPEFAPYLALVHRNWQVSENKVLQKFPLQKLQIGQWGVDDVIDVFSAEGRYTIKLWPEADVENHKVRRYDFLSGRLTLDGVEIAHWGDESRFQLLDDGGYLLGVNGKLYRGVGLDPSGVQPYSEKIWTLRRWRYEGLISTDEYSQRLEEIQ